MKPKPHRRLPKAKRHVIHPSLSPELLAHRVRTHAVPGAVTAQELELDVVAFIAERYADRHLDIFTAQLGLSNAAQRLIVAHLRAVAQG